MKYKKHELEHYNVHLVDTDKFKKIVVRIILNYDLKKEFITINNLLSLVLSRTNNNYKTNRELIIHCEKLYDLGMSFTHGSGINSMSLTANISLLDPIYAEESLLEESINLLFDSLFNPNIKNNKFDQTSFDFSIRGIRKDIESIEENPKSYANEKLLENMDTNNGVLSHHTLGYLEDLDNITPESLYEYYLYVIKNSTIDIVVGGNISKYDVLNIFKKKLSSINNSKKVYQNLLIHDDFIKEYQVVNYKRKTSQSIMKLGFKVEEMTDFEKEMVSTFYSIILGGTFESKLFQSVREKNSLCYGINSKINKFYNIMTITSGISAINYDKALSLTLEEVNNMLVGNISDTEMSTTAKIIKTNLEMDEESLNSIVNIHLSKHFDNVLSPKERIPLIEKVTVEDIKNLAKKIHLDTILLLEGDDLNEEN